MLLNYNGRKHLEQFLPSVIRSTYPDLQIYVADNGSTDDSLAYLKTHYPSIRILANLTNEGFAKGYNTALAKVEADIYVLLNTDVEVEPGWIEPVVALMQKDQKIAACQPKIRDWKDRSAFEYAGAAGGWLDSFGYPFCRGRVFGICEKDQGQYDTTEPVFWATGAALFIRADIFHEMGGFDPYFFAHQEEIDLCWRLQLAGYLVYACPVSVVYHVGGGTLPEGNPRKVFLNFRNNLIMLYKNLPWTEKGWKIPFRFLLDAISAWKNLLTGNPDYFLAVMKAHSAFFRWLLFHQRDSLFPLSRKGTLQGLFRGNMIWMHFVKGKAAFDEIIRPNK